MPPDIRTPRWEMLPDATAVAAAAAERILAAAERAIAARGVFRIALAGGRTPEAAYRHLAAAAADWGRWEIFFGDERCLPSDDPERNSVMAARAWLDHIAIPDDHIYSIPAELGAEAAALEYAALLAPRLPLDLALLGLGEDGHTASLFPGHVHDVNALVCSVHDAPKPPAERVSLGVAALRQSRQVLFLVTGAGKREALARWRAGERLPAAVIDGADTVILIDAAAWDET